jgi:hypothetical protein
MNNPQHIFLVKILKFFDTDLGSGIRDGKKLDPGSGMKKILTRDKHFGSATLLSVVAGCSCNLHPVAITPLARHSPKTLEEGDIRERGCQTENPQSVRTAKTSSEHGVNKNSNKTNVLTVTSILLTE